eukprot:gnl/TRDRNA2_/TRDRNA2_139853_c0_seq1.p1 gnl/TRDRNA2_/TRDRNA2_139853_c0~~gnl/TRDRNA2_/TRDRNA2_139853_c0_seq1.p1  ORF type:complete len:582 (+),score=54.97 gnl/TRDRNA2_/TRDRNA2_139853_c0_seq1:3-1748(+)
MRSTHDDDARFKLMRTQSFSQDCLRESHFFKDRDPKFVEELANEDMEVQLFTQGDFIMREGDYGESMYFLKRGEVEIVVGPEQTQVARLKEGSCFGEMALLGVAKRRTASIRALEFCDCRILHCRTFKYVLKRFPVEAAFFRKLAHERMAENAKKKPPPDTPSSRGPPSPPSPASPGTASRDEQLITDSDDEHLPEISPTRQNSKSPRKSQQHRTTPSFGFSNVVPLDSEHRRQSSDHSLRATISNILSPAHQRRKSNESQRSTTWTGPTTPSHQHSIAVPPPEELDPGSLLSFTGVRLPHACELSIGEHTPSPSHSSRRSSGKSRSVNGIPLPALKDPPTPSPPSSRTVSKRESCPTNPQPHTPPSSRTVSKRESCPTNPQPHTPPSSRTVSKRESCPTNPQQHTTQPHTTDETAATAAHEKMASRQAASGLDGFPVTCGKQEAEKSIALKLLELDCSGPTIDCSGLRDIGTVGKYDTEASTAKVWVALTPVPTAPVGSILSLPPDAHVHGNFAIVDRVPVPLIAKLVPESEAAVLSSHLVAAYKKGMVRERIARAPTLDMITQAVNSFADTEMLSFQAN